MKENQIQTELESSSVQTEEPIEVDNSQEEQFEEVESISNEVQEVGQSSNMQEEIAPQEDPSQELILGKFKSLEDLAKAYEELQKYQGHSSEELGFLRKELNSLNTIKDMFNFYTSIQSEYLEVIQRDKEKYSGTEYFQDPTFREIYREALTTFGKDLDTDRLINLLERYVSTRIQADNKKKQADKETQKVLDSMSYAKNPKHMLASPKKRFDEMTPQEVDELLDRLI